MAFELAEQNKYNATLSLLNTIEENCKTHAVITKTWETKAVLYRNIAQYDSALYSVRQLHAGGNDEPTGHVIAAQAFWGMEIYDSAIFYAKHVMSMPLASAQDKRNMLYILTYNDTTIDSNEMKLRSEQRDDLNRYVISPLRQQHMQAVDMLKQYFNSKTHHLSIIILLLFSICLVGGISWYVILKQHRYKQLQTETLFEQRKKTLLQQEHIRIIQENNKMSDKSSSLIQQQELLIQSRTKQIEEQCRVLRQSNDMLKDLHWKNTGELYEIANTLFYQIINKLKTYDKINEKEIRLCILVLIGGKTNKEMAEILYYGDNSIRGMKKYVAQKLGVSSAKLRDFLIKKAIGIS